MFEHVGSHLSAWFFCMGADVAEALRSFLQEVYMNDSSLDVLCIDDFPVLVGCKIEEQIRSIRFHQPLIDEVRQFFLPKGIKRDCLSGFE